MPRKTPGKGIQGPGDTRRFAMCFPQEMFEEIRCQAAKNGISMAEQVRLYVEWGQEIAAQLGLENRALDQNGSQRPSTRLPDERRAPG